ncbi:MAG: c-type cytochrome [Pseudomonadota bacterium]
MRSPQALGLIALLASTPSFAQGSVAGQDGTIEAAGNALHLVSSVFVTGQTVIDVCGDGSDAATFEESEPCAALVMGLYNGFLYGASYGGFVICVPEHAGVDEIVPQFVDYVRAEGPEDWNHAGDMVGYWLEDSGWGGYDGEACLVEPEPAAGSTVAPTTSAGEDGTVLSQVTDANIAAGEQTYRMCVACHSLEADGPSLNGPHLWRIVGRPVASVDGYPYSASLNAFAETSGVWDIAALNDYFENPMASMPGTSMIFRGIRDPDDRANLLAFLMSLSDE